MKKRGSKFFEDERTVHIARVGVEAHKFDRLVVAAGGDEIAGRTPGQAVNRSLVVFGALEEHRRRVRRVIIP